jgi:predicted GIY-YIG superfamily endonuclease
MALHNCDHTFEQLALDVLPAFFSVLCQSLQQPLALRVFDDTPGLIPAHSGCYVIAQQGTPLYVGIAKNMRRRIQDHLSGDPSRANLAVRMAAKHLAVGLSAIKKHAQFDPAFASAKQRLLDCEVAWVSISNPLEMYIFEPYCAMQLDTYDYNFFDTLQILAPKR